MVNKITTPPTTSELIGKVNELVDDKQDTLVSGTNIKTINNTSILGSGNIDIQGGGSYTEGTGIDITNNVISVDNSIVTTNTVQTITADKTITGITYFQNGSGSGCITLGADVGTTTLTADTRKIGRMNFRTQDLNTNCAFVSTDSQDGVNYVEFGGRTGDQTNTAPDVLRFTLATVHNSKSSSDKFYPLTIDKTNANFTVQPKYNNVNLATVNDIPTDTSDLTNGAGYITGITSGDVTTALGYTPYNSSNPDGYITSSALTPYVLSSSLATVATSGDYNDLTNKPVSRNIGEIIQSTIPLTDAGLHLLDGSLISGDGIYSDFYDYIVSLYNDYPQIYADEQGWQQDVSNFGVCGKFVFNTTNRTVRLPLIKGFIEGTNDLSVLDHMNQAGLPNITGELYGMSKIWWGLPNSTDPITQTGALRRHNVNGAYSTGAESTTKGNGFTFNASLSNSIYGNSSTVQPQSIKVLYYIVIATSTKTDIQVDIDEIATDLNGKADTDLSNINTSGKSFASGLGMPSDRYIDLTIGASGSTYTAPANGYFCFNGKDSSNTGTAGVILRNQTRYFGVAGTNTDSAKTPAWTGYILPAKKGDTIYFYYIGTLALNHTNWSWRFYYAEGEA